jgi:hypothetical protein
MSAIRAEVIVDEVLDGNGCDGCEAANLPEDAPWVQWSGATRLSDSRLGSAPNNSAIFILGSREAPGMPFFGRAVPFFGPRRRHTLSGSGAWHQPMILSAALDGWLILLLQLSAIALSPGSPAA